jgi:hypothetical protein
MGYLSAKEKERLQQSVRESMGSATQNEGERRDRERETAAEVRKKTAQPTIQLKTFGAK